MNYQEDVAEFMVAGGQLVGKSPEITQENLEQAKLYMNLIEEEFKELGTGFVQRNVIEIADGGADLVWVVQGLFTTLGIDFDRVWDEVRKSNMSKVSSTGKIEKRPDGKIMKPATYFKPDIAKALR
jgi:predicted HAD superfamily Cof-like phosphohydrolase